MASPPYPSAASRSASPPQSGGLVLPRQRPTLVTGAAASPTTAHHPLRQTSFPPPDSLEAQHASAAASNATALLRRYSPSADGRSPTEANDNDYDDFSDDGDIVSAISGPGGRHDDMFGSAASNAQSNNPSQGKKRKRGEKRPRGRPAKNSTPGGFSNDEASGSFSRGGGAATNSHKRAANSTLAGHEADGEAASASDSDNDGDDPASTGQQNPFSNATADPAVEHHQKALFRAYLEELDRGPATTTPGSGRGDLQDRFDTWNKTKLRSGEVRKLVNQTLSQSVPPNVVTVVSAYAKMFAGLVVEGAREVQAEWGVVEEERADGGRNAGWEELKRGRGGGQEVVEEDGEKKEQKEDDSQATATATATTTTTTQTADPPIKTEPPASSSPTTSPTNPTNPTQTSPSKPPAAPLHLLPHLHEHDRGPLRPDHLRESLRRYKRRGGTAVGVTGLSLEGREGTAARMGGRGRRRLFR